MISDTIIVRKRKKYRFARFAELSNCFEAEQCTSDVLAAFVGDKSVVLEMGAGDGLFLCEHAKTNPDKRFIAVDVKADRLYAGARTAVQDGINNIIFVRAHVDQLTTFLPQNAVSEMWLTFSDPFPKKRHVKHRLTHSKFLRHYRDFMKAHAIMHFKTDNHALFDWSLEQFIATDLQLSRLTYDLHASQLPDNYKVMTTYEKRYVAHGLPIYSVDVLLSAS